jgi:hypothetical protein
MNIYLFFFDGYPEPCGDYEAIGSASGYVRTLLGTFYEKDMDMMRGEELAIYCILQAMKVSRDIGQPIQVGLVGKEEDGKILDYEEIKKIIEKINGREKILHDLWNLISKKPELQIDIKNLIQKKMGVR